MISGTAGAKNFFRSPKKSLFYLAIPCFAILIAFNYVPIYGWIYSFFEYHPGLTLSECQFVGLKYFELAYLNNEMYMVLRNTLVLSFLGIACSPLPAVFAIMLSEVRSKKYKGIVQTLTTLPNFISWVIIYSIFFTLFSIDDGFVNNILLKIGLINEPTNLLGNPDTVWIFQTAISVWKGLGFSAIIYLASITAIDPELYDAAKVDGAGLWNSIKHITVPGLIPTYLNLLILGIGALLSNGVEQYYVFYNALVHDTIQVLDLYVYRVGLSLNDYSYSTAIGMSKTLVSLVLLFFANWLSKRIRGQAVI